MSTSMIAQDAETFASLGRAVAMAETEGVLDRDEARELTAALVVAVLTGCMEFDTYARVHETLARLLEKAFEAPPREPGPPEQSPDAAGPEPADEPLGVYLEVVGKAWDQVDWDPAACSRLKRFVERCFDLDRSTFGAQGWFRAPLERPARDLAREAKAAGLQVISLLGALPEGAAEAVLTAPRMPPRGARILLGWGDRRTAVDLAAIDD
ncbi:MAG: hypothetical protein Kow0092_33060 [Deferrisomatales bacterium]